MIPGLDDAGETVLIYVSSALQSLLAIALPAYLVVALTDARPLRYLKIGDNGRMMQKYFCYIDFLLILSSHLSLDLFLGFLFFNAFRFFISAAWILANAAK